MEKDYYHDVLLPEVVRYAKIRSMDPENLDEYGAAVFATWYTCNPLGYADRDNICNFDEPQEPVISDKKIRDGSVRKSASRGRSADAEETEKPKKIQGHPLHRAYPSG